MTLLGRGLASLAFASALASTASGQTFPADDAYVAGRCMGEVSTDPIADQAGASGSRDIVGVVAGPTAATFLAIDDTHAFLRQRVDDAPVTGGTAFRPFGWAWAFDTDGDRRTFELLVMVDGISDTVRIEANTVTSTLGSPSDRPESTIATYDAATNARADMAGSMLNGDADWFVTAAIPLSDFPGGFPGATVIWAGTSTNGTTLNGDIACHDNATTPDLSTIPVDPTIIGTAVAIDTPEDGSTIGDARPVITGTGEPGATVTITVDGMVVGTTTVGADGTWSFTLDGDLADGSHTVTATARDAEGNEATATVTFTVDTGNPDVDSDGDGVPDRDEREPDGSPRDTDGDGVPDHLDDDDDGDGIPTATEREAEMRAGGDVDGDGIPAWLDTDSDGDGTSDEAEGTGDSDGDTIPDYLDDEEGASGTDMDGDSLPDAVECPMGIEMCPDTDRDGIPDHLDADDDGDDIPTRVELELGREQGVGTDADGDGTPNHLDRDSDGDGLDDRDEGTGDFDGDGLANFLDGETDLTGAGLSGGALCSASGGPGGGALPWAALALLALFVRRRRGATFLGFVLLFALAGGSRAEAQLDLNQFRAAETGQGGFAVSRPDVEGDGRWTAYATFDYANDPLVFERDLGDADTETARIVEHQLTLRPGVSYAIAGRAALFMSIPVHLVMTGDVLANIPPADDSTLGDPAFGARVRLLGEPDEAFRLSAQASITAPLAHALDSDNAYSGARTFTLHPEALAAFRAGAVDLRANLGVRIQGAEDVANVRSGTELTFGLGGQMPVYQSTEDASHLDAVVELYGTSTFRDFLSREGTPFEAIAGLEYFADNGLIVGGALGPGLQRGVGSPDLRVVLKIGYAPVAATPTAGPTDTDGDGIDDADDACPSEPEDPDAFEDDDGCPDPDNDDDGVLDGDDRCPNEPEDMDGDEDDDGCPEAEGDRDGDGILDSADRCPTEAEDRDNFQDDDGCPDPDNDGDGVLDVDDQCPTAPGTAEERGCPRSVRLDEESGRIVILEKVEFATNADTILERSFPILEEVRSTLAANPQITRVRVEGHTDDRGRDAFNLDLSRRRAASVRRWLIEHQIQPGRLEAWGCGETRPIGTNDTAEGRQANRRVEFFILGGGSAPPAEGCVRAEE